MEDSTGKEKYYTLLELLFVGLLGIILTGDLFNLFVFLEIASIASYALVAYRKRAGSGVAAIKYMVCGSIASSIILLAIAIIYGEIGSLNLATIAYRFPECYSKTLAIAFSLLITGFLFKSGAAPMHFWVGDAYSEAPTPISFVFSGISTKVGVYMLLRMAFLLTQTPRIGILFIVIGVMTIFVGATMALLQLNFKKLLAYSSIAQVGYIITAAGVGIAALTMDIKIWAIEGAIFHIINHALFKPLLFLVAGAVIYSTGKRNLNELGGLANTMPLTTICFIIGAFSIIGVPPMNGFASKWIIYESTAAYFPLIGIFCIIGSILTAIIYVKAGYCIFMGRNKCESRGEAPRAILGPLIVLSIICIFIGLFPDKVLDPIISNMTDALMNKEVYISAVIGS